MQPYLTIPIALPGDEAKGNEDKVVPCKIIPGQVLAYHEGYSWGTFIYLSTGQAFCSTLKVEEYEELVSKYYKEVAKKVRDQKLLIQ